MITVPEVIRELIKERPYIEDYLEEDIINVSSLARLLLPEVEEKTMKEVSVASATMALKRIQRDLITKKKGLRKKVTKPEIIVRSQLYEITFKNSQHLVEKLHSLFLETAENKQYLFVITQGVFETTIVASMELQNLIMKYGKDETIVSHFSNLSAITLKFKEEIIDLPGVYFSVLRPLVLGGISFTEIASTYSELTIILQQNKVEDAFRLINNSFK